MIRLDSRSRRSMIAACGVMLSALVALAGCTGTPTGQDPAPFESATGGPAAGDLTRQQTIARGRDLTLRVEVTTCSGYQAGSGFLVGPRLIATTASVLNGAQTVAVRGMHNESLGTVIGVDKERDVALIRTSHDVGTGNPLVLTDEEPQQGDEIVAVAYPEGRPQTPTIGTVSRLGQSVDVDDRRLHDVVQFDADTSPNSSGGPLLDLHGAVVGLTEGQDDVGAGLNYAVSSKTARPLIAAWTDSPAEVIPVRCPEDNTSVSDRSNSADGPGIAYSIGQYYDNINAAVAARDSDPDGSLEHYYDAYNMLSGPLRKHLGSFEEFRHDRLDVHYSTIRVVAVRRVDEVTDNAEVTFRTRKPVKNGECRKYHYRVEMRLASGQWTLDNRQRLSGDGSRC
ncbi:MAG: S1C family serine protease [Janthinobacterium lividum]